MVSEILKKSAEDSKFIRFAIGSELEHAVFTSGIPSICKKKIEVLQIMQLSGSMQVLVEYKEIGDLS